MVSVNLLRWEEYLSQKGYLVAGLDEVGRGPLAGPVVAAAVVLPPKYSLPGLADSKTLTPRVREALFQTLKGEAVGIGLGKVGPRSIDRINILQASLLAMQRALLHLDLPVQYLLLDGRWRLPSYSHLPQRPLIRGEGRSLSIAAASVVAKVVRDGIMERMAKQYPQYGFEQHKGYPTRQHLKALRIYGPASVHRRSFRHVTSQQMALFP